jgi:DNA polymerase
MDTKTYKEQLLAALYKPYIACMACPLATLGRTQVVFGQGNPDARLLLIGEAPGQDEDRLGLPFVGRSGQLLTRVLEALGISRNDDVYITNIVKCRPPNNRKPLPIESNTCKNLLLINQIKIIRPKVICTLGASSLEGLLGQEVKITKMRGLLYSTQDIPLIPTYHPAYILRNPAELKTMISDIEKAWNLAQAD